MLTLPLERPEPAAELSEVVQPAARPKLRLIGGGRG